MDPKVFAHNLNRIMKLRKEKFPSLSDKTKIPLGDLKKLASGKLRPTTNQTSALAKVLNVPLAEFSKRTTD